MRKKKRYICYAVALLMIVVCLKLFAPYFHKYNPYRHNNISQFHEYFISHHPAGTSESEIDAELVGKRGFKKSKQWFNELVPTDLGLGGRLIKIPEFRVGKTDDHYLVTYAYVTGYFNEYRKDKTIKMPLAYYFNLRYSRDGHLLYIQNRGAMSRLSKGSDSMIKGMYERGKLLK